MEIFTQVFTEVNAFFPLRETPRGHFESSKYTIYQLIWCKQLYFKAWVRSMCYCVSNMHLEMGMTQTQTRLKDKRVKYRSSVRINLGLD